MFPFRKDCIELENPQLRSEVVAHSYAIHCKLKKTLQSAVKIFSSIDIRIRSFLKLIPTKEISKLLMSGIWQGHRA
jgi:hypothetical protein